MLPVKLDFEHFTLGEGSTREKQQRIDLVVKELLSDTKQIRLCKDVVHRITQSRSKLRRMMSANFNRKVSLDKNYDEINRKLLMDQLQVKRE